MHRRAPRLPAGPPHRRSLSHFTLTKQLYKGKASTLYQATDKPSGLVVALKTYSKRRLSDLNWYQVEREIRLHARLRHPSILQLHAAFEDDTHVFMVCEFASGGRAGWKAPSGQLPCGVGGTTAARHSSSAISRPPLRCIPTPAAPCPRPGGDLYEDLKRAGGQMKERVVAGEVLPPFMDAVAHMHALSILHRDIKPENILLGAGRAIKVADFGLSINAGEERPVTRAGTLDYMSPEVLLCPEKSRPEENKVGRAPGGRAGLGCTGCCMGWLACK
jgi:aurora kinase